MEPGAFAILFPLGHVAFPAENLEGVGSGGAVNPAQLDLPPRHPKSHPVRYIVESKTSHRAVDYRGRFPALETYSLPPAPIHRHNYGANPHRLILPDFQCLRRRNWNAN